MAGIQLSAFVVGLATVGLVYATASVVHGREPILVLVLAGVWWVSLAGAAISLLKILADPYDQLPAIVFLAARSLSAIRKGEVWAAAPLVFLGLVPLILLRWRINALSLGDEEPKRWARGRASRLLVVTAATLMTASVVAISGVIGWVGLVIPHIARMLVGPELRPAAADGHAAGRQLSAAGRHAGPHHGAHRGADRYSHRRYRCPILPLAACPRPRGLVMSGPMLEVRSLGFGYGAKVVGRDVDLEARPREVLCLLGPNGSGKTTLFKTMLGLLPPQAGEVRLDGIALAQLTRPQIARRVAYVPQAHAAHFPFTVIDMVVMGRTSHLGIFASPTGRTGAGL